MGEGEEQSKCNDIAVFCGCKGKLICIQGGTGGGEAACVPVLSPVHGSAAVNIY